MDLEVVRDHEAGTTLQQPRGVPHGMREEANRALPSLGKGEVLMVAKIEIELPEDVLLFLEWMEGPDHVKAWCEKAVLAILSNHIDCL